MINDQLNSIIENLHIKQLFSAQFEIELQIKKKIREQEIEPFEVAKMKHEVLTKINKSCRENQKKHANALLQ